MPDCPVNYDCSWTMRLVGPKVPDQGDWSLFWISLVAITLIVTIGLLVGMAIVAYADTHKEMSFKVK